MNSSDSFIYRAGEIASTDFLIRLMQENLDTPKPETGFDEAFRFTKAPAYILTTEGFLNYFIHLKGMAKEIKMITFYGIISYVKNAIRANIHAEVSLQSFGQYEHVIKNTDWFKAQQMLLKQLEKALLELKKREKALLEVK